MFFFHRCLYPARCVSEFRSTTVRELPKISTTFRERGVCISACDCTDDVDKQCGLDGNTYLNECYRICAEIPVSLLCFIQLSIDLIHCFVAKALHT